MSDRLAGGVKAGSTSVSTNVVLRSSTDNTEVTGKVASDMTLSYRRSTAARVAVSASDLSLITSPWAVGGVKQSDSSNMPGEYRVDWPDAAFATGADWVVLAVKVSGCFTFYERFALETAGSAEVLARVGAAPAQVGSAMVLSAAYDFAKGTAAMTEAYAADGAAPTPAQALFLIQQRLTEFATSGTTLSIKKLDGTTEAATLTFDDPENPTSSARAT